MFFSHVISGLHAGLINVSINFTFSQGPYVIPCEENAYYYASN